MSPAETILANLPEVRDAFTKSPGPSGAWSLLLSTCPSLTAAMSLNTFRVLAPAILLTVDSLHKGCATTPRQDQSPAPKTFMGWSVQTGRDGYIRLHQRLGGKVRSVYVGKVWDEAKARERIAAKALD